MADLLDDGTARDTADLRRLLAMAEGDLPLVRGVVITMLHEINDLLTDNHSAGETLSDLVRMSGFALVFVFHLTVILSALAARRFSLTAARLDDAQCRGFTTVVGSSPRGDHD